jgi:osmoprotectant transport system permease protein
MYGSIAAYFHENNAEFLMMVVQHLKISGIAIAGGIAFGISAGIFSIKSEKLYTIFSGISGMLRVVPSLALIIVCIPILGVGVAPSIFALTVLAVPPILINTAIGFRTIPESIIETAIGMGMDRRLIFFKVKLPLAMPLILTGVKTASVEVVSSATLAAYIGAGGLGNIIFTGLGLYRMDLLLVGGISVAVLSLLTDWSISIIEWYITRYQRV